MTVDFSDRAHWNLYDPADFGWSGKWDPMRHPDLLVPFTFTTSRGETLNFGRMHKLVVPIYTEFYRRLDAKHPGVLDGDPDDGCFNPRSKRGGGGRSFHSYGIATDTEWRDNPMYAPHHPRGPHALPLDTGEIGRDLGLQWGGDWDDPKDWMHVEVHLSPDDCIALARKLGHTDPADPLEEVMAMYGSKEAFENAMRALVREEVRKEGDIGFNVRRLLSWTNQLHTMETFVAGNKTGYVSIAVRVARAAAAKRKAAQR